VPQYCTNEALRQEALYAALFPSNYSSTGKSIDVPVLKHHIMMVYTGRLNLEKDSAVLNGYHTSKCVSSDGEEKNPSLCRDSNPIR
jgi:hypothetical protein